jgi:hypothetical protein
MHQHVTTGGWLYHAESVKHDSPGLRFSATLGGLHTVCETFPEGEEQNHRRHGIFALPLQGRSGCENQTQGT